MSAVELTFSTRQMVYQREYTKAPKLGIAELGKSWAWFFPSLSEMAAQSNLKPMAEAEFSQTQKGIENLVALQEFQYFLRSAPGEQTSELIFGIFNALEARLVEVEASEYQMARISRAARQLFVDCLARNGYSDMAVRVERQFTTSMPLQRGKGRALISDMPRAGRPPLAGVAHASYAELKQVTAGILDQDLQDILRACSDVIQRYEKALESVAELMRINISSRERKRVLEKPLRSDEGDETFSDWTERELNVFLVLLRSGAIPKREARPAAPPNLVGHLRARMHGISNGADAHKLLRLDLAPPAVVLLACALVLQIHTHWNFISVLELTVDDLIVKEFPHKLQSTKPKTGDDTPPSFVERADQATLAAMEVLVARWRRLVLAGRIQDSERSVWLSSRSIFGKGKVWPVVGWGSELRAFTKRYALPAFSLEQVRVQCLATVAIGPRGISGVMQVAGHASYATSLRYIDKLLLRRLNAANSHEFERRLEATIRYLIGKDTGDERLIDYPIGDGASCKDPVRPPDESWLESGICRAEQCHADEGCPNRSLVINEDRLEEAVRTKNYYLANWLRLADENSVKFEKIQLPHMLFSLALFGVLKRGPYRYLLRRYEPTTKAASHD